MMLESIDARAKDGAMIDSAHELLYIPRFQSNYKSRYGMWLSLTRVPQFRFVNQLCPFRIISPCFSWIVLPWDMKYL